jgi:hypothetical protein
MSVSFRIRICATQKKSYHPHVLALHFLCLQNDTGIQYQRHRSASGHRKSYHQHVLVLHFLCLQNDTGIQYQRHTVGLPVGTENLIISMFLFYTFCVYKMIPVLQYLRHRSASGHSRITLKHTGTERKKGKLLINVH